MIPLILMLLYDHSPFCFSHHNAFQISEELDTRIKNYLAAEKERTGKKVSQREFIVGLIEQALDAYEAADTTAE